MREHARRNARYWDGLAAEYQSATHISVDDFHFAPLVPGERELGLLPADLQGKRCLELGCGAGQNSIFLARQGAEAVAVDVSAAQVRHGQKLAKAQGVSVRFLQTDMEDLPADLGDFDLIHSAYGLPFAADPAGVVADCARRLRPGGTLLLSIGHPVYAGEWLELDEDERGLFLTNYFHPTPDVREGEGESESCAQAYPVSVAVDWILRAGLRLTALLEPQAVAMETLSEAERLARMPYYSAEWAEQAAELRKVPIVLILRAQRDP
jgi:SAM-dependent methyltransferase